MVAPTTVGTRFLASVRGASTIRRSRPGARGTPASRRLASSSSQLRCRNSTSISSPPSCSCGPLEVLERRRLHHDVRRKLHEDAAQLAGVAQRLERRVEAVEHLGAELARGMVDPAAVVDLRPRRAGRAGAGRPSRDGGSSSRTPSRGRRTRRACAAPSAAAGLGRGNGVVARVHLDRVEELGVVAQPALGRAGTPRIPRLDQRLVGPRAGADADRRRQSTYPPSGSSGMRARRPRRRALRAGWRRHSRRRAARRRRSRSASRCGTRSPCGGRAGARRRAPPSSPSGIRTAPEMWPASHSTCSRTSTTSAPAAISSAASAAAISGAGFMPARELDQAGPGWVAPTYVSWNQPPRERGDPDEVAGVRRVDDVAVADVDGRRGRACGRRRGRRAGAGPDPRSTPAPCGTARRRSAASCSRAGPRAT